MGSSQSQMGSTGLDLFISTTTPSTTQKSVRVAVPVSPTNKYYRHDEHKRKPHRHEKHVDALQRTSMNPAASHDKHYHVRSRHMHAEALQKIPINPTTSHDQYTPVGF